MLDCERLVLELLAVDGFATCPVACGKVATLDHEAMIGNPRCRCIRVDIVVSARSDRQRRNDTVRRHIERDKKTGLNSPFNNTMERAPLVRQRLSHRTDTLLACAEAS